MVETEADIVQRFTSAFENAGAERVEPGYLQPADVLLDLYGEDIRARAYTTNDPVRGELMLRPDFTVPVAQMHFDRGDASARYTYAGPVWRRQSYESTRSNEFWQIGFEVFGGDSPDADAEVFVQFSEQLQAYSLSPITGDLGLVLAGIEALSTSDRRKAALRRHVWRPNRFQRLLNRFAGLEVFDCDVRDPVAVDDAKVIGLRSAAEISARLDALKNERNESDLSTEQLAMLQSLLALSGASDACLKGAQAIARSFKDLTPVVDQMSRRLDALSARGVDIGQLQFDANFGRDTMEYYDGFVFAFRAKRDGSDVATGGRYDALTRVLGKDANVNAVGGVARPALLISQGAS